ncbi:Hypothetical protein CAP_1975 [Chondromyces apiculatus DSM 436]|uniref:Uncharacterized protein n=1 Tax=Chondromyces apiculatus DSM 436 TaxID=1192034 RepID=A0A017TCB0_9BACT|nr:Hypothetical protein CAP_1975 [Chondromyces apiculatus DSM 436]
MAEVTWGRESEQDGVGVAGVARWPGWPGEAAEGMQGPLGRAGGLGGRQAASGGVRRRTRSGR